MNVTETNCPLCEKPLNVCICDAVTPFDNKTAVLILRHPQEQDRKLGTARLVTMQLNNSSLKTGLSWANLAKALGRPADNKKWGVLYLGSAKAAAPLPVRPLTVVNKKGDPVRDQDEILAGLEGIILLDGNWAQAKALWWRNAWLLKCQRLILQPPGPSLYGNLRKEPRKESVSTIEAVAWTLASLENDSSLPEKILPPFHRLLEKTRGKSK